MQVSETCQYVLVDYAISLPAHSVSAGLDYPGVGPEHAYLQEEGRAEYVAVTDGEALGACREMSRREGILPALETAHAIAAMKQKGNEFNSDQAVIHCFSGRGDKDLATLMQERGD